MSTAIGTSFRRARRRPEWRPVRASIRSWTAARLRREKTTGRALFFAAEQQRQDVISAHLRWRHGELMISPLETRQWLASLKLPAQRANRTMSRSGSSTRRPPSRVAARPHEQHRERCRGALLLHGGFAVDSDEPTLRSLLISGKHLIQQAICSRVARGRRSEHPTTRCTRPGGERRSRAGDRGT